MNAVDVDAKVRAFKRVVHALQLCDTCCSFAPAQLRQQLAVQLMPLLSACHAPPLALDEIVVGSALRCHASADTEGGSLSRGRTTTRQCRPRLLGGARLGVVIGSSGEGRRRLRGARRGRRALIDRRAARRRGRGATQHAFIGNVFAARAALRAGSVDVIGALGVLRRALGVLHQVPGRRRRRRVRGPRRGEPARRPREAGDAGRGPPKSARGPRRRGLPRGDPGPRRARAVAAAAGAERVPPRAVAAAAPSSNAVAWLGDALGDDALFDAKLPVGERRRVHAALCALVAQKPRFAALVVDLAPSRTARRRSTRSWRDEIAPRADAVLVTLFHPRTGTIWRRWCVVFGGHRAGPRRLRGGLFGAGPGATRAADLAAPAPSARPARRRGSAFTPEARVRGDADEQALASARCTRSAPSDDRSTKSRRARNSATSAAIGASTASRRDRSSESSASSGTSASARPSPSAATVACRAPRGTAARPRGMRRGGRRAIVGVVVLRLRRAAVRVEARRSHRRGRRERQRQVPHGCRSRSRSWGAAWPRRPFRRRQHLGLDVAPDAVSQPRFVLLQRKPHTGAHQRGAHEHRQHNKTPKRRSPRRCAHLRAAAAARSASRCGDARRRRGRGFWRRLTRRRRRGTARRRHGDGEGDGPVSAPAHGRRRRGRRQRRRPHRRCGRCRRGRW